MAREPEYSSQQIDNLVNQLGTLYVLNFSSSSVDFGALQGDMIEIVATANAVIKKNADAVAVSSGANAANSAFLLANTFYRFKWKRGDTLEIIRTAGDGVAYVNVK